MRSLGFPAFFALLFIPVHYMVFGVILNIFVMGFVMYVYEKMASRSFAEASRLAFSSLSMVEWR